MNRLLFSLPQSILNRSLPTFAVKNLQPFVVKPINYKLCSQLLHTSKILKYCSKSITPTGATSTSPLEGASKLAKDVIVFKYENPNFFKYLNIFAICQYLCWNYLAYFSYTSLRDAPVEDTGEDVSWWRKINLGENKYRNTLTIACFLIGRSSIVLKLAIRQIRMNENYFRLWNFIDILVVHTTIGSFSNITQGWCYIEPSYVWPIRKKSSYGCTVKVCVRTTIQKPVKSSATVESQEPNFLLRARHARGISESTTV